MDGRPRQTFLVQGVALVGKDMDTSGSVCERVGVGSVTECYLWRTSRIQTTMVVFRIEVVTSVRVLYPPDFQGAT